MRALTFTPGARGELTFARSGPDYIEAAVLSANTNVSVPIPAGARFVLFSSTGDFYSKPSAAGSTTAAVPTVTTTTGAASECNPGHWSLDGYLSIGVIAPATCIVTLTFYA